MRQLDVLTKINSEDNMTEKSLKQFEGQYERLGNIQLLDSGFYKSFGV